MLEKGVVDFYFGLREGGVLVNIVELTGELGKRFKSRRESVLSLFVGI